MIRRETDLLSEDENVFLHDQHLCYHGGKETQRNAYLHYCSFIRHTHSPCLDFYSTIFLLPESKSHSEISSGIELMKKKMLLIAGFKPKFRTQHGPDQVFPSTFPMCLLVFREREHAIMLNCDSEHDMIPAKDGRSGIKYTSLQTVPILLVSYMGVTAPLTHPNRHFFFFF